MAAHPEVEATAVDPIVHYILQGWRDGNDPHPLFSVSWYLGTNPDVARSGVEPLTHYLEFGAREGRDPHPLFLGQWYLRRYPDVAASGINPLEHFVRYGGTEGRDPHPLFDGKWYLQDNPDVAAAGLNPLLHYVLCGVGGQRDPHPLFRGDFYLAQEPRAIESREGPLPHFLRVGNVGRRDPHPLFSSSWYLACNPDVAHSLVNPLMHFVEHGLAERRDNPHPLFSTKWYLANNPDVAGTGVNPLVHYVRVGAKQRRSPHPFFDGKWYAEQNPGIAERDADPLTHYLQTGAAQRRDPHPSFSTDWYLAANPDAALPDVNPLVHYLAAGIYRGAAPNAAVTQAQCERVRRRAGKDASYCAAPGDFTGEPWPLPAALEQALAVLCGRDSVSLIRGLYSILDWHRGETVHAPDLAMFPELEALIDDVRRLSGAAVTPGEIDASVVIPVHNQIVYTLCCLRSLLESRPRSRFEIIVTDDASDDATAAVIGRLGGIVRYRRNATVLGYTRNCNVAANLARGHVIVFLNNDTIPLPNWLDELIDILRADASVGLVGSKLLNSDGTLQEAGGIVWQDGSAWNFGRGRNALEPEFGYLKDVDYVSGAAISVRKSVWERLHGFDETFVPAYCEETDLAFRVRGFGLRTIYQPFSVVIHHEGVSHGRDLSSGVKAHQVENNRIFTERWKEILSKQHSPNGKDALLARDRSRTRPHILFIDHHIPQPDRDAGSRTMAHYLKLFQESGFQVSFWPENRYFDQPYAEHLQRLGIEVLYDVGRQPGFVEYLRQCGRYLDYVFLSRAGVAINFIDSLRAMTTARILFYGHDIHFRRLEMEYAISRDPAVEREREGFAYIERSVWPKCDVIYYLSEEECDYVRGEHPTKKVRQIPAFIFSNEEIDRTRERLAANGIPTTRRILFVGGFRHRPNVDAVLWFATEIWPELRSAVPDAHLCIAGSFPPPDISRLADEHVDVTGAVSDEVLRQLYLSSQVAIVPLRFGGGVKGKVLEALSQGTPIVTTSIGIQGMPALAPLVDACDTAQEFTAAVIGILQDPSARLPKVLAGLDFVAQTASEAAARRSLAQDLPEFIEDEPYRRRRPAA